MTHAVRTFLAMLELAKLNPNGFAARAKISHSTITRFVQGREPSADLLRLLCTSWDDPRHGLEVLRAHLLDEIERSGRRSSEFAISFTHGDPDEQFAHALEVLDAQSRIDADLRATLVQLARMIERHAGNSTVYLAAEPTPAEISNSVELHHAKNAAGARARLRDAKPSDATGPAAQE